MRLYKYKLYSQEHRLQIGLVLILAGILLTYFVNNILPVLNLETERWSYPDLLPYIHPLGTDFREGYFYPAKVLLQGKSPYVDYNLIYPPFSAVFSIPFRLFPVKQAYLVQVFLLYMLNAICLLLALGLAERVFKNRLEFSAFTLRMAGTALFTGLVFWAFTSYGFLFSVERGNSDIYPLFYCLLALWFMLEKPQWLWLPVLLIGMATHLKLYPAVMFIPLLYQHGRRSLLPIAVVNSVLLLVAGPINAIEFIKTIVDYSGNPFIWVGNHSAASFGDFANNYLKSRLGLSLPGVLFYGFPLLLAAASCTVLWKRGYSPYNAVLMFIALSPLMNLIPSVSHDYKSVILHGPLALFLSIALLSFVQSGQWRLLTGIALVLALMLLLHRSYSITPPMLMNKYPFILIIQLIFSLSVFLLPEKAAAGQTQALVSVSDMARESL